MEYSYGSDEKSAYEAKSEAQKIAFGPVMFQAAKSLRDLRLLEALHNNRDKGLTIDEAAEECSISVYGAKVLLEAGLSLELVYAREGKFFITKTGWFMINDNLTRVNMDFVHDVNYLGFFRLKESIEKGRPEGLKVFGEWDTIYEGLSELPEGVQRSWFNFDHFYSDISFPEILPIVFQEGVSSIMDIGGNTGKFAVQCAEYNNDVNITILDLPGQLNEARQLIRAKGFENRINMQEINILKNRDPFPSGYDAVWMSQFLDCFSMDDIVMILKLAAEALNKDGAVYILETYWDEQKFEASTYSLHATSLYFTCMANGVSQMYHHGDMMACIDKAGLKLAEEYRNIGISHTLYKCIPA